jgi:ABC-type multidrug transport system ATPase subunit
MLGLKECADTFVGNEFIKGISGGQARRLSIAIQLLMDPYVLLLDECTTGLDAFNARNVMLLLK